MVLASMELQLMMPQCYPPVSGQELPASACDTQPMVDGVGGSMQGPLHSPLANSDSES